MLSTSTVTPFEIVITSPGTNALPFKRLSVAGIRPTTFTGSFAAATAQKVPITAAAPDMSHFMSSMKLLGFRLMPPVS